MDGLKMLLKLFTVLFAICFSSVLLADEVTTTTVSKTIETPTANPETSVQTTITTTQTVVKDEDQKIMATISDKIAKNIALTGTQVTVASKDGVVTLSGAVTMQSQADEAYRLAKETPGVTAVSTEIQVKTKKSPQPNK